MNTHLAKALQFLSDSASSLINGCKVSAFDQTTLFTPDGISSYNALWLRDFSYMVEYAGECITDEEIIGCVNYAIRHRRSDGWMPDRVYADGTVAYAAGEVGSPIGAANLDNTPFLIFTVYSLMARLAPDKFRDLFDKWEPYLFQGLSTIPLDESGLVRSDPSAPHSPYGFTDTVAKTGALYMESLLYWRACLQMSAMTASQAQKEEYLKRCGAVEASINLLYDASSHAYLAATGDCRQIDIWGNAYMLYINFPCSRQIRDHILHFLLQYYDRYTFRGQIRHLLSGEYWQRLLIDIRKEEYQNGAYWATASGWVIWCLAQIDKKTAAQIFYDVVAYFETEGSYECINRDYRKLPSFVVSTTNVWGAAKRLSEDTGFNDAYETICKNAADRS